MRTTILCAFLFLCPGVLLSVTSEQAILAIQQRIGAQDLDGAEKSIALALKDDPRNGGLFNLRGIIHAQRQEYDQAAKDFSKAVELSPGLSGAYLNLARIYQLRSKDDDSAVRSAIDVYRRLLRLQPGSVEARSQLVLMLEKKGDFNAALAEFALLPASEQQKAPSQALRCLALAGAGRMEEAQKAMAQLRELPDFSEHDALEITGALLREKKAGFVRDLMEGLARRGQLSTAGAETLMQAYEALGLPGGPRAALEKLARETPPSPILLVTLSRAAYRQHDLEGALGYLAHARELSPQDAAIHFFFGIVAVDLDLAVEARQSLQRAVELDPDNAYYQYALGGVELQMGGAEQALVHFRTYSRSRPDDARGHFAIGAAQFKAGDVKESRSEMELAARSRDTLAGAEYFLGRIARLEGNSDEAKEHLERSVQADPKFAESRAELGRLNLERGDVDAARNQLQRALELDADSYQANLFLLALYQRTKDPRVEAQRRRVDDLQKKRSLKQDLMLRTIHVQPDDRQR